jgi:hypothetical protein
MSALYVYYRFKLAFSADEVKNTFENDIDKTGLYLYVKPVNGAIWEPKDLRKLQTGEYALEPIRFKLTVDGIVSSADMVLTIPANTNPRGKVFSKSDFEHFFEVRGELWKSGVKWWYQKISTEYFESRTSTSQFAVISVKTTDSPTKKSQGDQPNNRTQSLSAPQFVGVLFWVERDDFGHAWVTVHRANKENVVYSYGRFGDTWGSSGQDGPGSGKGNPFGEGIMLKIPGKRGIAYNQEKLQKQDAKAYHIKDVDVETVYKLFESVWNSSSLKSENLTTDNRRDYGHVLDQYKLLSNNCTTLSGKTLERAGTKVFIRKELVPAGYRSLMEVTLITPPVSPDGLATLLRNQASKKPEVVEDYTAKIKAEYSRR